LAKASAAQDSAIDPTRNLHAVVGVSPSRRSPLARSKPDAIVPGETIADAAADKPRSTAARAAEVAPASQSILPQPTANAEALTPKDQVDLTFNGFNSSIGWIPGVGTVISGVKLAIDVVSLAGSVITLNATQVGTELGNIVVDIIGLVPVVGAPVASLIYETVLGGNLKLGRLVQESMQNLFSTDPTWADNQFQFDAVDVSPGIFGLYTGIATVSTPTQPGVGVAVDIVNNGFETSWSVPLEGRLALLGLSLSSGSLFS
jgi:hypothetical protein